MREVTVFELDDHENAVYHTQRALDMRKFYNNFAKECAHHGREAMKFNAVGLGLTIGELIEEARSTPLIKKFPWQKFVGSNR